MSVNIKPKSKHWSQRQVNILVGEINERKDVLFGRFDIGKTSAIKNAAWQEVADRYSAYCICSLLSRIFLSYDIYCSVNCDLKKWKNLPILGSNVRRNGKICSRLQKGNFNH